MKAIIDMLAEDRTQGAITVSNGNPQHFSDGCEDAGVAGELAFSRYRNIPMSLINNPKGDCGIDFVLPSGYTVDVKTSKKHPHSLFVLAGKASANIYVLAHWDESANVVKLMGWQWGRLVGAVKPVESPYRHGIYNHCWPAGDLRRMEELRWA